MDPPTHTEQITQPQRYHKRQKKLQFSQMQEDVRGSRKRFPRRKKKRR